ncbi:MAG: hypothetical protein KJI71_04835 [Patescibacteria group bacterium]|nr:hypothetical protein [Patescibacteria group bacterium]
MSDYLVIRIPLDKPDKPEIIEFLSAVPIDWKKYLKEVAEKEKKMVGILLLILNTT